MQKYMNLVMKEMMKYRNLGMYKCRNVGMQEHRSVEKQECRNVGTGNVGNMHVEM